MIASSVCVMFVGRDGAAGCPCALGAWLYSECSEGADVEGADAAAGCGGAGDAPRDFRTAGCALLASVDASSSSRRMRCFMRDGSEGAANGLARRCVFGWVGLAPSAAAAGAVLGREAGRGGEVDRPRNSTLLESFAEGSEGDAVEIVGAVLGLSPMPQSISGAATPQILVFHTMTSSSAPADEKKCPSAENAAALMGPAWDCMVKSKRPSRRSQIFSFESLEDDSR